MVYILKLSNLHATSSSASHNLSSSQMSGLATVLYRCYTAW